MATIVKVYNKRTKGNKSEYLVIWSDHRKTWEKAEKLKCPELIQKFEYEVGAHFHPVCKFKNGLRPLRIVGASNDMNDKLIFVMEFLGTETVQIVMAEKAYMLCPDLVIQYLVKNADWGPNHKKVVDPYELQLTKGQVNKYIQMFAEKFGTQNAQPLTN